MRRSRLWAGSAETFSVFFFFFSLRLRGISRPIRRSGREPDSRIQPRGAAPNGSAFRDRSTDQRTNLRQAPPDRCLYQLIELVALVTRFCFADLQELVSENQESSATCCMKGVRIPFHNSYWSNSRLQIFLFVNLSPRTGPNADRSVSSNFFSQLHFFDLIYTYPHICCIAF